MVWMASAFSSCVTRKNAQPISGSAHSAPRTPQRWDAPTPTAAPIWKHSSVDRKKPIRTSCSLFFVHRYSASANDACLVLLVEKMVEL